MAVIMLSPAGAGPCCACAVPVVNAFANAIIPQMSKCDKTVLLFNLIKFLQICLLATTRYFSNAKMRFQSSFMLTTVHPLLFA